MEDRPDTVQCKHCKKPILRHAAAKHIQDCLAEKQKKAKLKKERKEEKEKAQRKAEGKDDEKDDADMASVNGDKSKGARKSAADGDGSTAKKTKKRKAESDPAEKVPKKKKKDEPKPKAPKTKGPVDVEKQCGVKLPNGAQCARSLTCKSHSMGAKRAVPGRSLPYDMLLQQYQKKNQAKQQSTSLHEHCCFRIRNRRRSRFAYAFTARWRIAGLTFPVFSISSTDPNPKPLLFTFPVSLTMKPTDHHLNRGTG